MTFVDLRQMPARTYFWALLILAAVATRANYSGQDSGPVALQAAKIETSYDSSKDRTTVRLAPVLISGEKDKYHSLHMSPSFSFPGGRRTAPDKVDFELQTVVKGRLRTDLYVVFIIDGETVFLSSNRWAVKRPVPGRVWIGERLVFRMPYGIFVKITKAKEFDIQFDGIKFSVGETQKQALRELLTYMAPEAILSPSLR